MLRQQANDPTNPAQFIITTFHPQIVMVADNIYGVSHSNKISKWVSRALECIASVEDGWEEGAAGMALAVSSTAGITPLSFTS